MDHNPGKSIEHVALLVEPARREIFEFVAGQGRDVSRDETAASLGIGRALAAFHLDKLAGAGLLTTSYRRPPGKGGPGAGRPAKLYRWPGDEIATSFPSRNYELMGRLLVEAMARRPASATLAEARRLATARGRALGASQRPGRGESPERALQRVLADQGFRPQSGGSEIRLLNCPFRSWADLDQRTVCHTNAAFQRGILTGLGIRDRRAVIDRKPGQCCVVFKKR